MPAAKAVVRQSLSLPKPVASRVKSIAQKRKLSTNRVLVELVEEGLEARQRRETEFDELLERFRSATDPGEVQRLGDQVGRMIFG